MEMSNYGTKGLVAAFAIGLSWYTGVKFWQPLIIEQLQKDGNLRDDVYVRDTSDQPKSWEDIKQGIRGTLHPELKEDSDKPETEK